MKTWWLTLGDFEDSCGRILELTFDGQNALTREVLCHMPPDGRAVHGKGFTGGVVSKGTVFVCGYNAVYRIDPGRDPEAFLVRNDFNDLHHVTTHAGKLWVANTGLDRVDVFSMSCDYEGGFALVPGLEERRRAMQDLPEDPYFAAERLDQPLHLRRLADRYHPNHVAFFDNRSLVTRFADRKIQELSTLDVVFEAPGHPHDGFIHDGLLWMTCTNGTLLACQWSDDKAHLEERWHLDVFARTGRWGWCRGLWVGPELILVGLTRITRMPRQRWCERPFEGSRTSVLLLERGSGSLLAEARLDHFGKYPKLFSILEVDHE